MLLYSQEYAAQCAYTVSGSSTTPYYLVAGDTLCLQSTANYSGIVHFRGGVLINNGASLQTFDMTFSSTYTGGTFINNGPFRIEGDSFYLNNKMRVENNSTFDVPTFMRVQGNSVFINSDTLTASYLDVYDSGEFINDGLIDVANSANVLNPGTMIMLNGSELEASSLDVWSLFFNYGGQITTTGDFEIGNPNGRVENNGGCFNVGSLNVRGKLIGGSCGTVTVSGYSKVHSGSTYTGEISGNIAVVDNSPSGSHPIVDANSGSIASR